MEKERPLTLPIGLVADGKWRSSASGWRLESPDTYHRLSRKNPRRIGKRLPKVVC
jgi:hypothetical protein